MKNFLTAALLSTTLLFGCAAAEEAPEDFGGAASAPADINHPDSIYFPNIDFSALTSDENRIILSNYPTALQSTDYSCGPVAALTVLHWFGNNKFDEAKLIKKMNTKPLIGTSLSNMVKFFRNIGWEVHSRLDTPPITDEEFKNFVWKNLSEGTPIMVENVEYGGHWRVIVGYDTLGTENTYDDILIFADPFDTSDHHVDGFAFCNADRFFYMWFDHSMLPENEREQPWLTARPKGNA